MCVLVCGVFLCAYGVCVIVCCLDKDCGNILAESALASSRACLLRCAPAACDSKLLARGHWRWPSARMVRRLRVDCARRAQIVHGAHELYTARTNGTRRAQTVRRFPPYLDRTHFHACKLPCARAAPDFPWAVPTPAGGPLPHAAPDPSVCPATAGGTTTPRRGGTMAGSPSHPGRRHHPSPALRSLAQQSIMEGRCRSPPHRPKQAHPQVRAPIEPCLPVAAQRPCPKAVCAGLHCLRARPAYLSGGFCMAHAPCACCCCCCCCYCCDNMRRHPWRGVVSLAESHRFAHAPSCC